MNDKLKHFFMGLSISLFFGVLISPVLGVFLGIGAGIAKELIWDKWLKKGTPEVLDFLATALGSLLVFVMLMVLSRI